MSGRITIQASDPASASRALPWPVLERGNISYPEGAYSIIVDYRGVKDRGQTVSIAHEITGAPLITRWIAQGKLRFTCAVAAPISAYRKLITNSEPSYTLRWDPHDIGSHPVFTPMIVTHTKVIHAVEAQKDGIDPLWDGHVLHLPKAAKVAIGPTFALKSGLLGLLNFRPDDDLKSGQFRLESSREDGFKFEVRLSVDLYRYLKGGRSEDTGANVMTHIVSAALGVLASDYTTDDGDEGWASHPNLVALAALLEEKGVQHWSEETFDAALAATTLHPHRVPIEYRAEDE